MLIFILQLYYNIFKEFWIIVVKLLWYYNNSLCVNPWYFISWKAIILWTIFKSYNMNSDFASAAKDNSQRKKMLSLIYKFCVCIGEQQTAHRKRNNLYLWPGSKAWMWAVKRTFNLQRRKSQIQVISLSVGVYLACGNSSFKMVFLFQLFSTA